jgi:hypothetical protein
MSPSEGQVHASGIVLQHYAEPDKVTGLCLPSWRVTSSSIVYSPNLGSGTATIVSATIEMDSPSQVTSILCSVECYEWETAVRIRAICDSVMTADV